MICSIVVLVIGFVPGITSEKWWQDSSLAPAFKNITKASLKYLPDEVASYFESAKQGIGKAADELGVPNNINTTPASDNTAPATRPDSQQPQNQPPKTTSDSGEAEQTQQILQSIDDSRQDSTKEAKKAPTTTPKTELILESYQEQ